MVSPRLFIVFILPIIFSILVGSVVMVDILQKPDRELNMWPISNSESSNSHGSTIEIIGLLSQYSISEPVEIEVKINDSSFNCGDLYITIYTSGKSDLVTQSGFFEQCFESGSNILPLNDTFSNVISTPGSYQLVVNMVSKDLFTISTSGIFTIK
jgi:hypothetical protein|tara:strand:- start:40 stop:504 length:465 start_codon:yes stop_codon:yes gene_type:complete